MRGLIIVVALCCGIFFSCLSHAGQFDVILTPLHMKGFALPIPVARSIWIVAVLTLSFNAIVYSETEMIEEYRPLLDVNTLLCPEEGALLSDWTILIGDTLSSASDQKSCAKQMLSADADTVCIASDQHIASLASPIINLSSSCLSVSGAVISSGPGIAQVHVVWMQDGTVIHQNTLRAAPVMADGRRRHNLSEAKRPEAADSLRLMLTARSAAGNQVCWHTVHIVGFFVEPRRAVLTLNRVGYELLAPKVFTVNANFETRAGRFYIEDAGGSRAFEGMLPTGERIQGGAGTPWDGYYYRGNFSALDKEGEFLLTVELPHHPPLSAHIRIGFQLLWERAFAPALLPFKTQRCRMKNATDVLRLWNDNSLFKTADSLLLWDIVRSWSLLRGIFSGDAVFAFLQEEALYGVDRLSAWLMTDAIVMDIPDDDALLHAASLACFLRHSPEKDTFSVPARLIIDRIIAENLKGPLAFSAAMDMFVATGEEHYLAYARSVFPGITLERVEPLLDYEEHEGVMITIDLNHAFLSAADHLAAAARNPYGLVQTTAYGRRGFFIRGPDAPEPTPGNTPRILSAMELMAQALRYASKVEYRTFVYDQINWLLGNNPFGICLVEGVAEPGAPRIALPEGFKREQAFGAVLHGVGPGGPDSDHPAFDMTLSDDACPYTNGYSLYNNARYISAMAYLKRIPIARPKYTAGY